MQGKAMYGLMQVIASASGEQLDLHSKSALNRNRATPLLKMRGTDTRQDMLELAGDGKMDTEQVRPNDLQRLYLCKVPLTKWFCANGLPSPLGTVT